MDLLTKSLLEDLLETPITVALYGGGFKPPTKGHFNVVEKTLEELPDIDQLILYVGGGERDGKEMVLHKKNPLKFGTFIKIIFHQK